MRTAEDYWQDELNKNIASAEYLINTGGDYSDKLTQLMGWLMGRWSTEKDEHKVLGVRFKIEHNMLWGFMVRADYTVFPRKHDKDQHLRTCSIIEHSGVFGVAVAMVSKRLINGDFGIGEWQ